MGGGKVPECAAEYGVIDMAMEKEWSVYDNMRMTVCSSWRDGISVVYYKVGMCLQVVIKYCWNYHKFLLVTDIIMMTSLDVVFRYTYNKIFSLYNMQDEEKNET